MSTNYNSSAIENLLEIIENEEIEVVDYISNTDDLKELWEMDVEAYGECAFTFEEYKKWWETYKEGLTALYINNRIVAAYGIWPISRSTMEHLKNGEIKESAIKPLNLWEGKVDAAQHWYIAGIVSRKAYAKRILATLINVGFVQWLSTKHVQYPVEILAIAMSPNGRNIMERFGFKKIRELYNSETPYPLYSLRATTKGELEKILEKRNLLSITKKFPQKGRLNRGTARKKIKKLNIVHISDIHMVEKSNSYYTLIKEVLFQTKIQIEHHLKGEKLDFVCITGDIAHLSAYQEYKNFKECFLDQLKPLFHEDVDFSQRILMVPGNHDIARDAIDEEYDKEIWNDDLYTKNMLNDEKVKIGNKYANKWRSDILGKFEFYKEFEKQYIKKEDFERGCMDFSYFKDYVVNDISIGFAGINSAWSYGKHSIGKNGQIKVGFDQFSKIRDNKLNNLNKLDIKIVLLHHPKQFYNHEPNLFENLSNTFNLILCGHEHDADISNNKLSGSGELIVSGALFDNQFMLNKDNKYRFNMIEISKTPGLIDCKIHNFIWDTGCNQWERDIYTTKALKDKNGVIEFLFKAGNS